MAQLSPETDTRQTQPRLEEAGKQTPRGVLGIRFRVLTLIFAIQTLMIWWVSDSEIVQGIYLTCYSLMMPTALYLLLTRILRRWLPFEYHELLFGYIVLTASMAIIGFGGMRFVTGGMGYLQYFSQFQPKLARYLPELANLPVLHDPAAIQGLYNGGAVPWQAWILPITFWSIYLLLMSAIWLCLAGILRRIWIHQERLSFPTALLPLQMADPREDIFSRPAFWIGFGIPAVLQSLLALGEWFPTIPSVQLKAINVMPMIATSRPWNAIPDFQVGFYPMAIGLAYFVPSNISFSCWLFPILMRLSYVVGSIFGLESSAGGVARFPYRDEQAAGAWIGFAILILWGARKHWRTVIQSVSPEERWTVRFLWIGAGICTALCGAMMTVTGFPAAAAAIIILVYVAYVISGARIRAEAGGMWTFAPAFWTPQRVMGAVMGTQVLDQRALVSAGHFDLVHIDIRAQSLPYLMEGLDIAEKLGLRWRTVLTWIAIATLTALATGWWSTLAKFYSVGAATASANLYHVNKARIVFDQMDRLAVNPMPTDAPGMTAMGFAAGFVFLLAWLRSMGILGLHPLGYVACSTYTMNAFTVPFFMAWAAKVLALRLGGHSFYRRSIPFFLGIILGDIVTQAAWALIGFAFKVPIYQFLS